VPLKRGISRSFDKWRARWHATCPVGNVMRGLTVAP